MKISETGLSLIKQAEGCKLIAYRRMRYQLYDVTNGGLYLNDEKAY
ncbi:hypothetical protein [Enterobacillus tribolii]|uniref:Uncharacterized protein n=1 Tax=Enterobacillus tribolii TaxID=1487935 RepID=A0A370R2R0_9GAMM|nr:hypothetical protein [Enterobacillus tribolii]RDK96720.1 hypothetical protein C8D90_101156 [Enterobacillus tribolii]